MVSGRAAWLACLVACISCKIFANPWGRNYFPNTTLITDSGKKVRFFDDLIQDKIVLVNFIYTSCPDVCPLETAKLVEVQNILGNAMGKEIFFYSITIDPKTDKPDVLKDYKRRFKANWDFLTGKAEEITELRKKLGLYVPEIQNGSNNHNLNIIIGNQKTGRWMKRSPFENANVLADQIGNWLSGWKRPQNLRDYASAPKLRSIPRGEQVFRTRCATCHTVNGREDKDALGPDLLGVTQRRNKHWLNEWLLAPDRMLAEKDPIAMALYEKYDRLAMPNMRLNRDEAHSVLSYIDSEGKRLRKNERKAHSDTAKPRKSSLEVINAWIRQAHKQAKMHAAYLTLINISDKTQYLSKVHSPQYERVEIHEMTYKDGNMGMAKLERLEIPPKGYVILEPAAKHLMLINPKRNLEGGDKVSLTLKFLSGQRLSVPFVVKSNAGQYY